MIELESHLRSRRDGGRKLLAPYVTAGIREDWVDLVRCVAAAGADAIEIGIPFSDPVMDGPTVQEASVRALRNGMTPAKALDTVAGLDLGVPLIVMTYYNLVFRFGDQEFAEALAENGKVSGVILPDLPMEEAGDWKAAAAKHGVATVMLVAPNTPDDRLDVLCRTSEGFVYAVSTLGVTGERGTLAESAKKIGDRVRGVTDKPVMIGFGISSPQQAVEASQHADGVIVASSLMRRVMEGASVAEIGAYVHEHRVALDS